MSYLSPAEAIPRKIHQTWKTKELPLFIDRCVASVAAVNPGWSMQLHTDEDLERFIAPLVEISGNRNMITLEEFRKIPTGVEKSDVFRFAVLYLEGGLYCDLDIEAIRPFDDLLEKAWELGLLKEDTEVLLTTDHPIHCRHLYRRDVYMNHFMIARPGARLLEEFLCFVGDLARRGTLIAGANPVFTTGPAVLTHLIDEKGGLEVLKTGLMPSEWINPLPNMCFPMPEQAAYEQMIQEGTWRERFDPFAAHYWWHNYCGAPCMFQRYGEKLFEKAPLEAMS
jgi:hypothetical protein